MKCHMNLGNSRLTCFNRASDRYDLCIKRGFAYIDEPHVRRVVPEPVTKPLAEKSTVIESVDEPSNEKIDIASTEHPFGIGIQAEK